MQEQDLLRTENDENQLSNATPAAEETAQENVIEETTEQQSEPAVAPEETAQPAAEVPAEEPAQAPVEAEPVQEPVAAEPAPAQENEPAEPAGAQAIMDEIENANAEPETDDETDTPEESVEQIEAEYAQLSLEDAVEELHRMAADPDYNRVKQRVGVLRSKIIALLKEERNQKLEQFLAEGGQKENFEPEKSDIERKFDNALQIFKNNKNKFLENIEAEKQRNLETKNGIIDDLRKLLEENEATPKNLKELNDSFKELQEKWKNVGPVPQSESNNLWQNYHFYVEKFFDILRINRELKDLDLKKNLEQKIKLCEQAESLLLQDSVKQSFKELQDLHEKWKEIGPVPEDKKEELWERFKNASDQINQRRREHYEQIYAEQQNNYNAKVVLCEKAEEFTAQPATTAKEFNAISDQLTELLKVWKTLGAAPPKVNEEIWNRFKGTLDKFFEKKKEFFGKIKDEQQTNYNMKVNLAIRAEAIAKRTDWRAATDEILQLQKEWKEIGATSRKHSEAIWKRFRTACDQFFEAKSNYFNNAQEIEAENLKKKEELIERLKNHAFGADRNENLEAIKAYQREWTEIGFVPKKEKDRIYAAYREALDQRFADLKISAEDRKRDNYRSRINNILSDPNADRLLDKEKRFLMNKLEQLKNDISIWENNLGFFANSKNADLLKAEFSKKIDAAKQEVKELEYKLKMMNEKPKEE
ncbi:MAG: DUF349 domain-containing protein [Bacteroidales bacterium]|nr:DUF349 domain-containing protein [Bacteroidales bacterium]